MITTAEIRKEQEQKRIMLRCNSNTLTNIITEGTTCSLFEAEIITKKAKEVFRLDEYSANAPMQPGQMIWQAIDQNEPPGKPLDKCKYRRIVLTVHKLEEDLECEQKYGSGGLRQQQIVRITEEALEQETLLTIEDLRKILTCNEKTVRIALKALAKRGMIVPTRGNKKDIGPGVTHRYKTLELFIKGHEPLQISRQLTHSLKSVERYIHSFCRVVYTQKMTRDSMQTALITGFSMHLVNQCFEIRDKMMKTEAWKKRIEEIEELGSRYWESTDSKKKASHCGKRRSKCL